MELFSQASWLSGCGSSSEFAPPELFVKRIVLKKSVKSAVWKLSARGLVSPYINGKAAAVELFLPGWTDYRKRIPVREISVGHLLEKGENTLEVTVAPGWYCGWISRGNYPGGKVAYGRTHSWAGELTVVYADGSQEIIPSDGSWCYSDKNILSYSDFYRGERCDYNVVPEKFFPAETVPAPEQELCRYDAPPVRVVEVLEAQEIFRNADGSYTVDFGKNIAGRTVLSCTAARGQEVKIVHGEVLNPDGSVYTANLRSATGTSIVIWDGKEHTYRPEFTYYGFRYCQISGVEMPMDIHAEFLSSLSEREGFFECSDSAINQLYDNIICSQLGNSLEIPSDCPQRNERLGWMGDIQIFIKTALYNFAGREFYLKYLDDVVSCANEKGDFPLFVPFNRPEVFAGTAGWSDALLSMVWELYRFYGDKEILERYHPALSSWLEFLNQTSDNFIRNASRFGDWCAFDNSTPPEFVATAFYARAAKMLADIAGILGDEALQKQRMVLFNNICKVFTDKFTINGRLIVKNQSAPIFALGFELLPESFHAAVLEDLLYDIEIRRQHCISTGFLTTGLIFDVLSKFNCRDTIGRILLNKKCPSLLYPVLKGATSIWEHWDGIREDGSFADPAMNSFNHYALGSFGSWFYEYAGGIRMAEAGFRKIRFEPFPLRQLDFVKVKFRGISTFWQWRGDDLYWKIDTPVETELVLPERNETVIPGRYCGVSKGYINKC